MKKSDLRQNMIVECRNGKKYLVLENVDTTRYGHQDLLIMTDDGFMNGSEMCEDLTFDCGWSDFDIIKVMKWKGFHDFEYLNKDKADSFEVLWERQGLIKWQPWELEVLKHIPQHDYEICKTRDGYIYIKDESGGSMRLEVNLPSLPASKESDDTWLNIDDELARYQMDRLKEL